MANERAATLFRQQFMGRTALARAARRLTQAEMAELLGIAQDKYKQYEGRSLIPHELIPRFTLAAGIDMAWLFTGRGKGPAMNEPMPQRKFKVLPPRRRKSA